MDSTSKAILKISDATDADVEAGEAKCDELLKAFLAVGKRAELGFNQSANGRYVLETVSGAEWPKMTKAAKAVFVLRHGNASKMRQYAAKKGWLKVAAQATDY